ncbi:hypothetical protein Tco_1446633 [Tanacetum coccineum]
MIEENGTKKSREDNTSHDNTPPTATTTTNVTNAQLQTMINQGVSAALAARDATRNGTDSHSSGTGVRGSERVTRESIETSWLQSQRQCKSAIDRPQEYVWTRETVPWAGKTSRKQMKSETLPEMQSETTTDTKQEAEHGGSYTAGSGIKKPYGGSTTNAQKSLPP